MPAEICPECGEGVLRQETDNGVYLMVCDDCGYAENMDGSDDDDHGW